jgi:hypothetical protein
MKPEGSMEDLEVEEGAVGKYGEESPVPIL